MKNRYIIGLGNYARGDDSIGLRVVEHIIDNQLDDDFQAIEIGNDGIRLLNYFEADTEKIVLVDCALMDQSPGDYLAFDINELESKKEIGGFSTHEGDILKVIEMAHRMKLSIPPIRVIAIQPEFLEMEMTLSKTLEHKLSDYVALAMAEIKK